MDNIFDPRQWADVGGYFILMGVVLFTLVLALVRIAGDEVDEWLEDRIGSRPTGDPFGYERLNRPR